MLLLEMIKRNERIGEGVFFYGDCVSEVEERMRKKGNGMLFVVVVVKKIKDKKNKRLKPTGVEESM
jgi:hypothetical protein